MPGLKSELWRKLAGRFSGHDGRSPSSASFAKSHEDRERTRQVVLSIPHYLRELARLRSPSELYSWVYFKFPYFFPLVDFPVYLSVEVTNECNFSCEHCWRQAKRRPVGSMDVALFEKIVREVSLHRGVLRAFKLVGCGEGALHPRFRELMEIAANYDMPTYVYTNGSLLQLYNHREILSWKLDTIVVGVDGVDADSYERIKIGGKYASLRKAIMDFYERRKSAGVKAPMLEVRHTTMPGETAAQLLQFRKTWLEIADTVKFNHLEPPAGAYEFENPARPRCRGLRREMGIWWDGTMPLCAGYWTDHLGNVRDMSISERWRHPKMEYLRQCHERRDLSQVPACARCPKHI